MPLTGRIRLVTSDQKYGTVRGDDGIERYFERPEQSSMELLSEGDEVTFMHYHTTKGAAAADVKLKPCPYCKQPMHTAAHMSVCPDRAPGIPPPMQAVKLMPARIGEFMVHYVPFGSQPDRGRFYLYDLTNVEVGMFKHFDNAVRFAIGLEILKEFEDA
jgi:cold shock CspA family protein